MSYLRPDVSDVSLIELFRSDAEAQIQILTEGLLVLDRNALDVATIEPLMRAAHSIKGAASVVKLDAVVQVAHRMEDCFVAVQKGQLRLTAEDVDLLLGGVDLIVQIARLAEDKVASWLEVHIGQIDRALSDISAIVTRPAAIRPEPVEVVLATTIAPPSHQVSAPIDVRGQSQLQVSAQNFDRLLSLASSARITAHAMHPLVESLQRCKKRQGELSVAVEGLHVAIAAARVEHGVKEKSELALQKVSRLSQVLLDSLAEGEAFERRLLAVSQGMFDEVLALRMRPFRDGVRAFPRMVRDLARSLGKEIRLEISGEDTSVDRDVLAHIESPLVHILRNALDHGIESPEARLAAGKPREGCIRIRARHKAGMLCIEIEDDGRGVDPEAVRLRVVERGLTSTTLAAELSPAELFEFLFLPAFSLKSTTNELSGRGVGLDLVYDTIRQHHGTVRIASVFGENFHTTITLPVTQSIIRALVVEVDGEAYALPITQVERVINVARETVHSLEGRQFFTYGEEHLGLVSAAQLLSMGESQQSGINLPVIIIGSGQRRYGLVFDAIRGEQSLVVQSIEAVFGKLRDIASASLLEDGAPVLILDIPDLLLSIDKLLHEGGLRDLASSAYHERELSKRVLVVDDSLTVREMERKLLVARGYEVDIAVDGMDGWNAARSGDYDLVITDVDMPRMDGIELATLIKKDLRLGKTPVMIVSYKDRPEDRARGIHAGADYYLTKGSFHDETLLEAVADLIGDSRK